MTIFRALILALMLVTPDVLVGGEREPAYLPQAIPDGKPATNNHRFVLVEYFTADTLEAGETKIGFDFDYALTQTLMVGADLLAISLGVPTLQAKLRVVENQRHRLALGLVGSYYDKDTVLWGDQRTYFEKLETLMVRPSISWTNQLSDRLNLHTYWSVGIDKSSAKLSSDGQRNLWERKNPGKDWATRPAPTRAELDADKELATSTISYRFLELQGLTGILKDIFQITGEYKRDEGRKVLITTRVQNSQLGDLKSNAINFTIAQQWIFDHFQFRIGAGLKYQVISGRDFDGQKIEDSGVLPATDIDFYWRF